MDVGAIISLVLLVFSVWLWIRNEVTFALLDVAGNLIHRWSLGHLGDADFDWQKNYYDVCLKHYCAIVFNPFIWKTRQVFKSKSIFETIIIDLAKKDPETGLKYGVTECMGIWN